MDDFNRVRESFSNYVDSKKWEKAEQLLKDYPTLVLTQDKTSHRLPLHIAVIRSAPINLINSLLSNSAQAACIVDAAGETPVHYLVSKQTSLELIKLFVRISPNCLEIGNSQGLLPLHKSLEYNCSTAVINEMIRSFPDGANERTNDGKLALHYACEYQASLEIVSKLLECNSPAAWEVHNGRLPMHYACENKVSLETLSALYQAYPTAASCKGVDGKQPLHLAVQHRCTVSVVEFLIQAHPEALMHRDRKGMHPIHYALERVAPDEIVRCMLKHRPDSAQLRGKGSPGNFPLCTAIEKHYCPEIILLILNAHPAAAGEKNMLGFWPLQLCIKSKVTDTPLLLEVLRKHPVAASLVDEHGRRTIHYAASRNMDMSFVKALLEADKKGASAQDKNGQIPLHLAVIRGAIELATILLKFHPNGVMDVDRYGMVALNYAIENDASMDMITLLVQSNPLCVRNIITGNRTVLHHAVEFRRSTEIIQLLVNSFPESARVQESVLGRKPLDWAIERLLPLSTLMCIDQANEVDGPYQTDHRGWRSIHYAIHYPTPTPLVQRLLQGNPELTQIKDDPLHWQAYEHWKANKIDFSPLVPAEKDAYLLLHYAVHNKAIPETVAEILMYSMPYNVSGKFNANHCDTWTYVMAHCCDAYWRSIDIVLTAYEHDQVVINKLAEFQDQTTQRCIDISSPRSLHEILRRMYFFSRYEMHKQMSIHASKHCLTHSAIFHNTTFGAVIANNPTSLDNFGSDPVNSTASIGVVLKFTNFRSKFIREISIRTLNSVPVLDSQFIVPLLAYHNAQEDLKYASEIQLKGFSKYPFLLVCKQGDRDLNAITKHEHLEGSDMSTVRTYIKQLLQCLRYLHETAGIVHGDIKPSNIIRESGTLKLTNMGAATKYRDKELVSAELQQLGYAAPELALLQRYHDAIGAKEREQELLDRSSQSNYDQHEENKHFSNEGAQRSNRLYTHAQNEGKEITQGNDLFPVPNQPGERILSAPQQDMWSIGCIFYLLLTGESLLLNNVTEDVDSDQLDILIEWPEFVKNRRLEKIRDPSARCLVSQLLSRDPRQRPSATYCLTHPFCADEAPSVRFVGAAPELDVYICYRRDRIVPISSAQESPVHGKLEEPSQDDDAKDKNLSAMQRMFGNISLSGSEAPDDSLSLEEDSIGADSQERSVKDDNQSSKGRARAAMNIKEADGRYALVREYFNELGTTAADTADAPITVLSPSNGCEDRTVAAFDSKADPVQREDTNTVNRPAIGARNKGREVIMSKCGAAVIVLSKESWTSLEDLSGELIKAHKSDLNSRNAGMRASLPPSNNNYNKTAMGKTDEDKRKDSEQQLLLYDFLYEIRLIIELQSMGLFENGVYIMAAGEPKLSDLTPNRAIQEDQKELKEEKQQEEGDTLVSASCESATEDRVLGEYFQQHMGDMIGRYGGSHPTARAPNFPVAELENRVTECLTAFGYGVASNLPDITLNEIFRFIVRLPTFHIIGPEREAFRTAAEGVSALIFRTARIVRNPKQSRPNTGAFNMLSASRLSSPDLLSTFRTTATATTVEGRNNIYLSKSSSFNITNSGKGLHTTSSTHSQSMGSIAAGMHANIYAMGGTVSGSGVSSGGGVWRESNSQGMPRTSSGRKNHYPVTPQLAPLQHSRPTSSDSSLHLAPLQIVDADRERAGVGSAQRSARSPLTGLRVRSFTPNKSPRHLGFTELPAPGHAPQAQVTGLGGVRPPSTGRKSSASPKHDIRPFNSVHDLRADAYSSSTTNIPIRPWSGADGLFSGGSFRNTTNFATTSGEEGEDFEHENNVAFYNNEDIVTVPYFTEIVGEDRVRTANAMTYMKTKLEASENQIANLEDELALLRAQMANKDVELSHLRNVVTTNALQSPVIPKKKLMK